MRILQPLSPNPLFPLPTLPFLISRLTLSSSLSSLHFNKKVSLFYSLSHLDHFPATLVKSIV
jgi:hypothetical protein